MLEPHSLAATVSFHPAAGDSVLIAGDESSLPAIESILAGLGERARGQVFVEVPTVDEVGTLRAPGRVMVCWLVRDRGQSLRRSVAAWLGEMRTDSPGDHPIYAWIAGCGPAGPLTTTGASDR